MTWPTEIPADPFLTGPPVLPQDPPAVVSLIEAGLTTCAICSGPLTNANALSHVTGLTFWTHLDLADWEQAPHQPQPEPGVDSHADKARDAAASLRAMVDRDSGRIDNWSDR